MIPLDQRVVSFHAQERTDVWNGAPTPPSKTFWHVRVVFRGPIALVVRVCARVACVRAPARRAWALSGRTECILRSREKYAYKKKAHLCRTDTHRLPHTCARNWHLQKDKKEKDKKSKPSLPLAPPPTSRSAPRRHSDDVHVPVHIALRAVSM